MTSQDLLARTFVELADSLVDEFDIIDLLTALADGCVELELADAAGILLADENGMLRVMGASSDKARLLELFQLQNDEGPCLEAYSGGQPVIHANLRTARDRWPHFSPEAVNSGFQSVHALPLRLRDEVIGALNLFGGKPGALRDQEVSLAKALGDVAAIAILQDQAIRELEVRAGQLQHALNSRVAIEQAKGMIAERTHTAMDEAFAVLRSYARNNQRHLTAVAIDIVNGSLSLDQVTTGASSEHRPPTADGS